MQTALMTQQTASLAANSRLTLTVRDSRQYGQDLRAFLDVISTATGRATHYNSKDEQVAAELKAHEALFAYDRTLYALLLSQTGTLDRAMQMGLVRLLGDHQSGGAMNVANGPAIEELILGRIVGTLSVPRLLKTFLMLRDARVNNGRTRRIVLRALLHAEKLELRAVRYRDKFRATLEHVLGHRMASAVRTMVLKGHTGWSSKEKRLFDERLGQYSTADWELLTDVLGFVLSNKRTDYTRRTPLIRQYFAARHDLKHGPDLPLEVLMGIRNRFHKEVKKEAVLEMVARDGGKTLTKGQRIAVQAQAEKAGVEIAFDPTQQDAVKLYVYAFERGMAPDIERALDQHAAKAAAGFPFRYGRVGLLIDASRSALGSGEQKLRPMAVTLATRDMLAQTGDEAVVVYAGGRVNGRLVEPEGDTSLAEGLVQVLRQGVDVVYVISDGYENSPAGRFNETVRRVRDLGIDTAIVQLNPVLAAEASGVRSLTADGQAIPLSDPKGLINALMGPLMAADPVLYTKVLVEKAASALNLRLEVV